MRWPPAQLTVPETYEQKRERMRVPDGAEPPRGSYRSKTFYKLVAVEIRVTWFERLGWYFAIEVWDNKTLFEHATAEGATGKRKRALYLTKDVEHEDRSKHWKTGGFWDCVAAGEQHARRIVALFDGEFPPKLDPFSRCDGEYGNDPRPRKKGAKDDEEEA